MIDEWDVSTIILGILFILIGGSLVLILGNNFIEYKEYRAQEKTYATLYPPTTAMNNGVQYTCEFHAEMPKAKLDIHIDWKHWYVYIIIAIIIYAVYFGAMNLIPLR